jgi:dsDNA-specific endonuclease/ATPase MutS2
VSRFEDVMGNIERNRIAAEQERSQTKGELAEAEELRLKYEKSCLKLEEQKSKASWPKPEKKPEGLCIEA